MLRLCDTNRTRANGLTKFGKIPYDLNIAVGIEFRDNTNELLYIALAKNNDGFEKLNRFLSHHNREEKKLSARAPEIENVFFIYPLQKMEAEQLRANEFIGVQHNELTILSANPLQKILSSATGSASVLSMKLKQCLSC